MLKKTALRVLIFVIGSTIVMLATCLIFDITDLSVIRENIGVAMFGAVFGLLTQFLGWVMEPLEKKKGTSLN